MGKTHVAAMIARALAADGHRVGIYKPVASGCRREGPEVIADDAVTLWEAADRVGELEHVCPQRFLAAVAPHVAAREEERTIDEKLLVDGLSYWTSRSDIVLVEGAGGLMSPISDNMYNADLALALGYPLVVVARNALGTINHTLQTLITAATFRDGLEVAGVVLNDVSGDTQDTSRATNQEELRQRCAPPVLASVGYGDTAFNSPVDWSALATT